MRAIQNRRGYTQKTPDQMRAVSCQLSVTICNAGGAFERRFISQCLSVPMSMCIDNLQCLSLQVEIAVVVVLNRLLPCELQHDMNAGVRTQIRVNNLLLLKRDVLLPALIYLR